MAAIGAINCTFVKGEPPGYKRIVGVWVSPGIDGYGVQWGALGDAQGRVTAKLFSSAASVLAWHASLRAAQGTIVTVVTDLASYANCLIAGVGELAVSPAYVPGGISCQGACEIEIVRVGS